MRVVLGNTAFIKLAFAFNQRFTSYSGFFNCCTCRNPLMIRAKRFFFFFFVTRARVFCLVLCAVFLRGDFRGFVDLGREVDNCDGRSFLFK